jgi:hypothetical protein
MVIPEKSLKKSSYHEFFYGFFKKKIKKQYHSITIIIPKKVKSNLKKHGRRLIKNKIPPYSPIFSPINTV